MPDRQVWSVSQVNLFIKNLLDETPQLSGLLVRGELSRSIPRGTTISRSRTARVRCAA